MNEATEEEKKEHDREVAEIAAKLRGRRVRRQHDGSWGVAVFAVAIVVSTVFIAVWGVAGIFHAATRHSRTADLEALVRERELEAKLAEPRLVGAQLYIYDEDDRDWDRLRLPERERLQIGVVNGRLVAIGPNGEISELAERLGFVQVSCEEAP